MLTIVLFSWLPLLQVCIIRSKSSLVGVRLVCASFKCCARDSIAKDTRPRTEYSYWTFGGWEFRIIINHSFDFIFGVDFCRICGAARLICFRLFGWSDGVLTACLGHAKFMVHFARFLLWFAYALIHQALFCFFFLLLLFNFSQSIVFNYSVQWRSLAIAVWPKLLLS